MWSQVSRECGLGSKSEVFYTPGEYLSDPSSDGSVGFGTAEVSDWKPLSPIEESRLTLETFASSVKELLRAPGFTVPSSELEMLFSSAVIPSWSLHQIGGFLTDLFKSDVPLFASVACADLIKSYCPELTSLQGLIVAFPGFISLQRLPEIPWAVVFWMAYLYGGFDEIRDAHSIKMEPREVGVIMQDAYFRLNERPFTRASARLYLIGWVSLKKGALDHSLESLIVAYLKACL